MKFITTLGTLLLAASLFALQAFGDPIQAQVADLSTQPAARSAVVESLSAQGQLLSAESRNAPICIPFLPWTPASLDETQYIIDFVASVGDALVLKRQSCQKVVCYKGTKVLACNSNGEEFVGRANGLRYFLEDIRDSCNRAALGGSVDDTHGVTVLLRGGDDCGPNLHWNFNAYDPPVAKYAPEVATRSDLAVGAAGVLAARQVVSLKFLAHTLTPSPALCPSRDSKATRQHGNTTAADHFLLSYTQFPPAPAHIDCGTTGWHPEFPSAFETEVQALINLFTNSPGITSFEPQSRVGCPRVACYGGTGVWFCNKNEAALQVGHAQYLTRPLQELKDYCNDKRYVKGEWRDARSWTVFVRAGEKCPRMTWDFGIPGQSG
ncbi:uncharacterized protein L3040_008355 [Drepanopeziza brunnea f. sp. 'multigermtubi']|uniref:uncharacterized protein n=1 Tax=Drepanopeziza brunnea f. sp. 'multigermtubi' TaxID=698441 RepID=UPI00238B9C21|nr:hypothetical protein L3040_008355 [Drepanopeziza brunnea f. sp. 'multigermtubi']